MAASTCVHGGLEGQRHVDEFGLRVVLCCCHRSDPTPDRPGDPLDPKHLHVSSNESTNHQHRTHLRHRRLRVPCDLEQETRVGITGGARGRELLLHVVRHAKGGVQIQLLYHRGDASAGLEVVW